MGEASRERSIAACALVPAMGISCGRGTRGDEDSLYLSRTTGDEEHGRRRVASLRERFAVVDVADMVEDAVEEMADIRRGVELGRQAASIELSKEHQERLRQQEKQRVVELVRGGSEGDDH